jgi:serine/threonine-protein kinase
MASSFHSEGSSFRSDRRAAPDDISTQAITPDQLLGLASGNSSHTQWQHTLEGSEPPFSPDEKTVISKRPPSAEISPPFSSTPQQLGLALVGRTLEHYELVEFVGGGGMGAVFRANDTRLGRVVAVKVLSRDQTDDETLRRFRNEAQSAARLDHPNIARAYYVGEDHGWNYIVFEFIEGTNLRDLVEDIGPLSLEDALSYTVQVAEALEHASSRDVVHRDIKPSNVLVMTSGAVKLVDMGLARLHQVESSSDDLTASGVTLGTFDYISPEQARDPRAADVRSDIYSLGCTLYYMLVGRPPFPDGTALQKLLRHNADEPEDVRNFRPELSPKFAALVSRMLAKRPIQRFQSPQELINELLLVADQLGLADVGRRGKSTWPPPRPAEPSILARSLPILGPLALLVLIVFAVDAYMPSGRELVKSPQGPKLAAPAPPSILVENELSPKPLPTTIPVIPSAPALAPSITPALAPAPVPGDNSANSSAVPTNAGDPAPVPPETEPEVNPLSKVAVKPVVEGSGSNPAASPVAALAAPTEVVSAGNVPDSSASIAGSEVTSASIGPPAPGSDAALSAASAPPGGEAAPVKITRLVVAPVANSGTVANAATAADTELLHSLSVACRRAAELQIGEIELQFDGELQEAPFDLSVSKLVIRAAAGRKPTIVFRPSSAGLAADRIMMHPLAGSPGRVQFQGVGLRLELPGESASGWALFALAPLQTLELTDCVLTVRDFGPFGAPAHSQVGMVFVQPRRSSEMMKLDEEVGMSQPATIVLSRTIARGQSSLVTMPDETPLRLVWNQGLFVSSQHLIETGGTAMKPTVFNRIELDLSRVTLLAQQGLYQMQYRNGASHHLDVDVECSNSILSPGAGAALFEFSGVNSIEDIKLKFAGSDNCYPREDTVFVRMKPASPSQATVDFDLNNRLRWSEERRPDPAVDWLSPPPASLPVHEHTKLHYLLKDETMSDAGFDPAQLPDIAPPAAAIPPAAVPAAAAPAAAPSAAGASSNLPVPAVDASAADATPDGE